MSTTTTPASHPSWVQTFAMKVLGLVEGFWTAYSPSLATETQQLLVQLAPIAISVVTAQATGVGSGSDKLNAATDQASKLAIAAGLQASTTAIQTAIQLAKIQLDAAAVPAAVTPVTTPAV